MATGALTRPATRPRPPRWRAFVPGQRGVFNIVFLISVIVIWEFGTRFFNVQKLLLPPATAVFAEWSKFSNLIIFSAFFTLHEALVGFAFAAVIGISLAVVSVYVPLMRQIVMTAIVGINATPKVALAPILVIGLGRDAPSKYALAFLLSFFPVVINSVRGLTDVPTELMNLYKLMQASPWQIFWKVRLPNALPAIFDGFKIALPIAMIGAVTCELIAPARAGIGYQMTIAQSNFNGSMIWACLITIATLALIVYRVLIVIEDRLIYWRPSKQVF
jgi:NitT/TauT family transport system permease protein